MTKEELIKINNAKMKSFEQRMAVRLTNPPESRATYRPYFTDSRTGRTEAACYLLDFFPSEVKQIEFEHSTEHITVEYREDYK